MDVVRVLVSYKIYLFKSTFQILPPPSLKIK